MQRVSILREVESGSLDSTIQAGEFVLFRLQKRMKSRKFYGTTTIMWNDGEIVVIREERSYKPADFDRLVD